MTAELTTGQLTTGQLTTGQLTTGQLTAGQLTAGQLTAGQLTAGRRVAVIGGGLAGITAAIALRDAGLEVTLLESRPRLGGAASSYARGPLMIDNGQHVFLRCCSSYRELLARLGLTGSVAIQDRFDVTVLSPAGQAGDFGPSGSGVSPGGRVSPRVTEARLRRSGLPSPLHLAGALATYPLLTVPQRLRVGRAALALRRAHAAHSRPGRAGLAGGRLDNVRLGDFLAARGQDEQARRNLWDLFVVSTLNIAGDDASVPLAAKVVSTGLLGARDAADIGMATVPLGDLHAAAPAALLARLGAQVRLRARVSSLGRLPGGGFRIGFAQDDASGDGQPLTADGVVLAVPPGQAARLGAAAGLARASEWDDLGSSPIVNVHVIYEQRVMRLPFAAAVDSPVQWVFDKTSQAGLASGQYLAVSLSAADRYVDMPAAELRQIFLPALERLFPAAAGTAVTDFFITRERRATFRQAPGSARLRPPAATPVPGLALAGAWTDTGWPDTMEGAVRSGHNAAREVIRELAGLGGASPAATPEPALRGAR
jgi:squalene-associated FAD-dependent desaturase